MFIPAKLSIGKFSSLSRSVADPGSSSRIGFKSYVSTPRHNRTLGVINCPSAPHRLVADSHLTSIAALAPL